MVSGITTGVDTVRSQIGITQGHVYTILDVHEVGGQKLLRIRNPWGFEQYNSKWSDDDSVNWDA